MRKTSFLAAVVSCIMLLASCEPSDVTNTGTEPADSADSITTAESTEEITTKAFNLIAAPVADALFVNGDKYYVLSDEELFVDHEPGLRGGHMGHAMVEYADGEILAFYPNCNDDNNGHSGRGWMEYKRSFDYGESWSEPVVLEYSQKVFNESGGKKSVMCEKAVRAPDGTIVLFCLVCNVDGNALWEPYYAPEVLLSRDGGVSWSEPYVLDTRIGRVYDAHVIDGIIYALIRQEGKYIIYTSEDNGQSFGERGSFSALSGSYYGTMAVLPDGNFIVYSYNETDEKRLQYFISENKGRTWKACGTAYFEKMLRNPQIIEFGGSYFCLGRSGHNDSSRSTGNIVVYCSENGVKWDSGHYIKMRTAGLGAYSNAIIVGTLNNEVPERLIYQSSHAYSKHLTNIYIWKIDMYLLTPS